ncbi:MAG: PAS domain S-box protein [Desulfobaccales bacterium]|nr:PAS domain S-box protein [Desulfobaccales bacterium]
MTDFLRGQIDFIYFVYGLGFFLLLPICLYLHRRPRSSLPWMWLLLFGATHGLLEWLDLVALSLGTDAVFDVVRLGLLILSFLLLAEFGRAGLIMLRGRGPGRWVLAVLLGLALLGAFAGLPGVRASARYSLGLVGALGAAVALWQAAPRAAPGRGALQGAALCLAGYAAAAGLVVDPAPFFPASWLNTEVFLAATGVPIQLGRGFLAVGLSACLSLFAVASLGREKQSRLQKWGRNLMVGTVVSVLVLVITGWCVTQYLGRAAAREVRTDQEHHGQVLEVSLTDKMTEADHLVAALAGCPGIISYLASRTSQNLDQANAVLDQQHASLPCAIMYVLDREGLTVASSNRLAPDSFLGKSYACRPYYRQALQGAKGSYWALGVTSGELGYYTSFPVRDDRGEIIGVAVINRIMNDLKGLFPQEALAVIIDAHGVVTLTNRLDMHLKSLWPLSAAMREQLSASRQFGPGPFAPILEQAPGDGGDCRFQGRRYLVLRQPLPFQDWSIVILTSSRPIAVARMLGLSIAILSCLVVLSLLTTMGLTIESTLRVQRSENRFRQLYGNLRDGSAVVDLSGKIVEWNPAFQAMLGYPPEELVKLSHRDLTPETWREQEARIIAEQVLPRGYSDLYEKGYRRRDGSVLPVELQTYLVQDDGGQPSVMWVFVRDLTTRKQIEDNLLEEKLFSDTTIDSLPGIFYLFDEQGRFLRWNENFERATGYSAEEFAGMHPLDFFGGEDKKKIDEKIREVFVTGESAAEADLISKDGSKTPYIFTGLRVILDGAPYLIGTGTDITQRRQAEEALRESEQKYRLLLANIPAVVFTGYADWAVDFLDDKVEEITGYSKEDFNARRLKWSDIVLAEDLNPIKEIFLEALKSTRAYVREYRIRAKNGEVHWVRERGRIFCDPQGRIDQVNGVFSDITAHKRVEQELEQLREQQEMILQAAGEGIFGLNRQGEVTFANPAAAAMIGYELRELVGRPMHDLIHHTREDGTPHLREDCPVYAALQSGETHRVSDDFFWRKDGQGFPVEYTATPVMDRGQTVGTVVVFKDITRRRRDEEALARVNDHLRRMVAETEERHRTMSLLKDVDDVLQSCHTAEEAYAAISLSAAKLFPDDSGALYLLNSSQTYFEAVAAWGESPPAEAVFAPDDCWSVRRNRLHLVTASHPELPCRHITDSWSGDYLCVPMMMQREAPGVLHVRLGPPRTLGLTAEELKTQAESRLQLAVIVAEHLGLSLANLKLRETLRHQAIRDPLTGLFNRRYLEETLDRELHRVKRQGIHLGVVMIDLDHFKQYNDNFGHNAGDELLVALGNLILSLVRAEDIPCRFGGEEFLLIIAGASLEVTLGRTEQLRLGVKQLHEQHPGKFLHPVTISAGVAVFPGHGESADVLIRAADAALYQAKREGRDRVVAADVDSA